MTKKFPYNFLRFTFILIIFFTSVQTFSQNVDLSITVNWPQWARENKVELYSPTNSLLLTVTHPNGYAAGSSGDNHSATSTTISVAVNDNDPANTGYYVRLYDRWGDGWNGSGSMSITVDGQTAFTFNGSFSSSASDSEISQTEYFAVNKGLDDASFSYSNSGFCQSESNPSPTIIGESGGTFSSTSGLTIDSSTGIINLSASTIGTYVVTYTTNAPDQNSATQNVSITDGDVATFSYSSPFATTGEVDLSPTVTGQSGSFSSTSGLSINSSTGVIDVSASTPGSYTVTYTTNGSCPKAYVDNVTILGSIFASSTVNGSTTNYNNNATKKYIEYIPGTMPVIISAPHGGTLTGSELSTRGCGTGEMDDNTDILIREIQKKCFEQFGVYPYIIINNLRRNKLDPNRNLSVATCGNSNANEYFNAYHNFIKQASEDINNKYGKGLYIDLHGQSHSIPRVEVGYNLLSNSFDENLNNSATNTSELARVTIKNLIEHNVQNLTFEDLIRGSQSFGGLMQVTGGSEYAALGHAGCNRSVGYRAVPSHISSGSNQGNCDDTNPGNNSYFAGNYYSNIEHGSGCTSNANSVVGGGGNVNGGGGTIDGIMTEVNRRVRDIGTTYSSIYGRTDGRDATIPYFSRDYGKVIEQYIDLHYNDFSKFSYAANSYDVAGSDPTPTITGITGGNFSSTSGLSINTSTGEIDLSLSSAGTYTVSYTAPNLNNFYKKEFNITITELVPINEFLPSTGNWSVITNWSKNRLPLSTDNITIASGRTANLDLSNVTVTDISVSGTLNVNAGKSLTVNGDLITTGTTKVTSNATSSGSLIVNGSSTGNIIYERYIKNNSNWFMISSPVENQDIDAFIASNTNAIASGANNNRGLSFYNNVSNTWGYHKGGITTSGNFVLGEGKAVRRTSAGIVTFTGNLKTDNDVTKPVTYGTNGWNLVGNSFASFLNVNDPANNTNNIIDINFDLLDTGYKAVYFWDTETKAYKPFNNSSNATYVSPGQGFFVKVNANGNLLLNENMQSHQSADLFFRGSNSINNRFEINLKVSNGKNNKNTEIKYIKGTTAGLDDGYDAGLFSSDNSFDVYTHLVKDDVGTKYAIQSLPNENYSNMIIPIGVNAAKNSTITFTADILNIPNHIDVTIEDKIENKFSNLNDKNTSYKVNLTEDINGTGRFFLHTQNSTLSTEEDVFSKNVSVFSNKGKLIIRGLKEEAKIKIYSLLGKQILEQKLPNKQLHQLDILRVSTGVYLIQIETNKFKIQKKIVLK